ncbi:unnamed protein product [Cercospora beticola]|nr:unnamed protein product [Cercospora beticola]
MQYLTSLLTVLGLATVALCADVEIDARFYTNDNTDDGCDNYATGCTDLAENSCCGVSQSGTRLYDSGDFYNTASGMGVTIQGKFFSRQNINDCGVVVCNNM